MPKLNPYYIKNIEKLPKTEEITYLDQNYQPQSYEEFMKTYEPNEEVEIITEAEWKDRVLHGSQYGPGNEQSRAVTRVVTTIAVTGLTVVCPPAGLAVGAGVAGGGLTMAVAGAANDNEEMAVLGLEMIGIGGGGAISGASGLNAHVGKNCRLPICPKK